MKHKILSLSELQKLRDSWRKNLSIHDENAPFTKALRRDIEEIADYAQGQLFALELQSKGITLS